MRIVSIQSAENANVKRWKKLSENARAVGKIGLTLAEGAHLAQTALEKGAEVCSVMLREGEVSAEAKALFAAYEALGSVSLFTLKEPLFEAVSPVKHGVGICVELAVPKTELPEAALCDDAVYLDDVQDAGNVGTILRTALASGVRYAALSPKTSRVWTPKVLRAAMGAHFSMTLFEDVAPRDLARIFSSRRLAADARGGSDLFKSKGWEKSPTVWMFGAEGPGLTDEALSVSRERFLIPIESDCESLNVAAAAAVCLFEQKRRRLICEPNG